MNRVFFYPYYIYLSRKHGPEKTKFILTMGLFYGFFLSRYTRDQWKKVLGTRTMNDLWFFQTLKHFKDLTQIMNNEFNNQIFSLEMGSMITKAYEELYLNAIPNKTLTGIEEEWGSVERNFHENIDRYMTINDENIPLIIDTISAITDKNHRRQNDFKIFGYRQDIRSAGRFLVTLIPMEVWFSPYVSS